MIKEYAILKKKPLKLKKNRAFRKTGNWRNDMTKHQQALKIIHFEKDKHTRHNNGTRFSYGM